MHCSDRPLIFVAHSLGGLIVKEALRRSRDERYHRYLKDVYRSTFAIIFFGTPHRGSSAAAWGEMLRRIASAVQFDSARSILTDLDPSSGSTRLDDLSEAFSDMLDEKGFQIYSFQESQGMGPLREQVGDLQLTGNLLAYLIMLWQVVPRESSALNERRYEIRDSINANHVNMCKFKGRDDDGYRKFLQALNPCVTNIRQRKNQARRAARKDQLPQVTAFPIRSTQSNTQLGDQEAPRNQRGGQQQDRSCM